MRRAVVYAAAIALLLSGGATAATGASAEARQAHLQAMAPGDANQELRERQCRFQWIDPGTWTDREERRTARCVVAKWGVIGGYTELDSVIACESGWWRFASNGGAYLGLAQHSASAWLDRVRSYMPDGWKIGPWMRWQNSRSQLVTTVRMVNGAGGWSAWSCA